MKKAVLKVRDVTKRVKGRTLLSHMSFSVYKNEICGFVGPNGSGKILAKVCTWNDTIEFHVYDSGPGFQEGDLQKVLQHFYQEDQSRSGSKEHLGSGYILRRQLLRSMAAKYR